VGGQAIERLHVARPRRGVPAVRRASEAEAPDEVRVLKDHVGQTVARLRGDRFGQVELKAEVLPPPLRAQAPSRRSVPLLLVDQGHERPAVAEPSQVLAERIDDPVGAPR